MPSASLAAVLLALALVPLATPQSVGTPRPPVPPCPDPLPREPQPVYLDPAEGEALRDALAAAGALAECDQPDFTSDVPLQTLTVFRSGSTRRSSTFSWFTSEDAFIAAHFAPLPGGGS